MSSISVDSINAIAFSQGTEQITKILQQSIGLETEYRLRDIIQEALQYIKHSKRRILIKGDLIKALDQKGYQSIIGLNNGTLVRYLKNEDLQGNEPYAISFFQQDACLTTEQLLKYGQSQPLNNKRIKLQWLAVNGTRTKTLEDYQETKIKDPTQDQNQENQSFQPQQDLTDDKQNMEVAQQKAWQQVNRLSQESLNQLDKYDSIDKPKEQDQCKQQQYSIKSFLTLKISKEIIEYFKIVVDILEEVSFQNLFAGCTYNRPQFGSLKDENENVKLNKNSNLKLSQLNIILTNLQQDNGLQPLAPLFVKHITKNLLYHVSKNLAYTWNILSVIQCLLINKQFFIEPYVHQLLPLIITCLVTSKLGDKGERLGFDINHVHTRHKACEVLVQMCDKCDHSQQSVYVKVIQVLGQGLLDEKRSIITQYGCALGLHNLDQNFFLSIYTEDLQKRLLQSYSSQNIKNGKQTIVDQTEAYLYEDIIARYVIQEIHSNLKSFCIGNVEPLLNAQDWALQDSYQISNNLENDKCFKIIVTWLSQYRILKDFKPKQDIAFKIIDQLKNTKDAPTPTRIGQSEEQFNINQQIPKKRKLDKWPKAMGVHQKGLSITSFCNDYLAFRGKLQYQSNTIQHIPTTYLDDLFI